MPVVSLTDLASIMPHPQCRFRLTANGDQAFEQNIEGCEIDLVKQTLSIDVRLTANGENFENVVAAATQTEFVIETVDANDDTLGLALSLKGAQCVSHTLKFNYGSLNPVINHLVFEFTSYTPS